MPKLPIITARKLIKILKKKGFSLARAKGSHQIFFNSTNKTTISVPTHRGTDLGRGITKSILNDADISEEEFFQLM